MTYGNYPELKSVKKILVIKMRHLGDVLLTTPLFTLLKEAVPHAEIDAYIYEESLPMLEGNAAISGYLLYDRRWKKLSFFRRLCKELSMLRCVRRGKYDLVINLTEGDRGALVALASGSRCRIGFDPGKKGIKGKRSIYTHVVKNCPTSRHMVERHLDVLRCLGIFPKEHERDLSFMIPEGAREKMEGRLAEEGVRRGEFLLIHPVSRWLFKCPLPEFYVLLIKRLSERVVLTSGPGEKERAFVQAIVDRLPDGAVVDLSGKTSLKELGALIEMSRALITVDSVPLHMASALKVPLVALFGPSSEVDWGPWRHPQSVVVAKGVSCRPCGRDGCGGSKLSDCLYTLSVDRVVEALGGLFVSI